MSTASGAYRGALLLLAAIVAALVLAAPASAAPTNDDFANAIAIAPGPVSGNNLEATKQAGEPNHAGNAGGKSVWFSWTPSKSGPAGISLPCLSGLDRLVGVYTGSAVNALTPVASSQGVTVPSFCMEEAPEFEFTVSAGTTYWIAADGRDGAQGFFEFNLNSAPANDDFASATALGAALPQDASGSVKYATVEVGEPDHAGDSDGHSVWFTWTPSVSGPVDVSTCSPFSKLDSTLAVYTGSDVNALTPVAANDDGASPGFFPECMSTDSQVRFDATAGTTYRIAIDGASGSAGRFNLRLRGRPANDDFSAAQALGASLPTSAPVGTTTKLATKEAGEPDHGGDPGGHSVWFTWTPSASGAVAISACDQSGSELDSLLAVYTGSAVNTLTPVASNDDAVSGQCGPGGSEVEFNAVASTTYRIVVDSKGGEGRFSLQLQGGPAGDAFATPQDLGTEPSASFFGSTKLATSETGEPSHAADAKGHSVWLKWTPSASGPVAIKACSYNGTGGAPLLAVYTGSAVNALTPVAADDVSGAENCFLPGSEVVFNAVAGTTYRIAVDSTGSGGLFDLQLQGAADNDDFADAEVLSPIIFLPAGGSTRFATTEIGEPNHAGNTGGHSVWFSWTPSESGPVAISACGQFGEELDTLLAVYTGNAVNALSPVASNDDAVSPPAIEGCSATSSQLTFSATAGTMYRIAVDSKGSVGRFLLAFERAPVNDDFADATGLSATLPLGATANLELATNEAGEPNHAGAPGGHSVWFEWTAAKNMPVAISTCTFHGDLDTLLAVYTGGVLNALTPVAGNDDDGGGCTAGDSEVQFNAVAGTTYRIAVDGKGGSTGQAQLLLEGLETNDAFATPRPLGGAVPTGAFGSNRFATKQTGEPDHAGDAGGASVWFKWTAPRTETVSIDTCRSKFDTLLAVYTGNAVNGLTPVASNDDGGGKCSPQSRVSFEAVANTVYRIVVDGKADAQGIVELALHRRPGNDAFSDAKKLEGAIPGYYGEVANTLATKEAGEPDHGGNPGGHSTWFRWTPVTNATVVVSACADTFDPLLAVYTGSAVNALTPVPAADRELGECNAGEGVEFNAVAGTTYRIAVDGRDGEEGEFELDLLRESGSTTPPDDEGGGGTTNPPPAAGGGGSQGPGSGPQPRLPVKKPIHCKAGFKKAKAHGKTKCVKKSKKAKKHRK